MMLERRLATASVKALLQTSGKLVEVGRAPDAGTLAAGYYVLHSIPGGNYPGEDEVGFVAPDETVTVVYQVDGVSSKYDGAEWLGDRARLTFLARDASGGFQVPLTPPAGWECIDRAPDAGPAGVDVSGVRPNSVFTVVERFRLTFTPN